MIKSPQSILSFSFLTYSVDLLRISSQSFSSAYPWRSSRAILNLRILFSRSFLNTCGLSSSRIQNSNFLILFILSSTSVFPSEQNTSCSWVIFLFPKYCSKFKMTSYRQPSTAQFFKGLLEWIEVKRMFMTLFRSLTDDLNRICLQ